MFLLRPLIKRLPSASISPRSPVCNQPSLSIAAAIALALVMNWWSTNVDEGTELDIALLNDTTSICGDEVILITDNQAMNLKNDASLKYDTLGSSNIQQYALNTKISQASSVKNEMHQIMAVSYTHLTLPTTERV